MYDYVLQYGFDKDTEQFIQSIKNYLKENKIKDEERNWLPHITIDLIENLKKYSKQNKIKNLYLWTTPDNMVALKFYKKMGFYKMGDYRPANGTF